MVYMQCGINGSIGKKIAKKKNYQQSLFQGQFYNLLPMPCEGNLIHFRGDSAIEERVIISLNRN